MSLKAGDRISYRMMPETNRYHAVVQSIDDRDLVLGPQSDSPAAIGCGRRIMITEPDTCVEHCSEITSWDGKSLRVRRVWTGQRGFFRVDDVLAVIWRKLSGNDIRQESRIFPGYGPAGDGWERPDASVNPGLWRMLVDMNAKLSMILNRLQLEDEGLTRARNIPVNISASGIRLNLPDRLETGDVLELKMLLPANPPTGLLVNGTVVRVEALATGGFETSFSFEDISEEVRDVIIQYTLKRQRKLVRRNCRGDEY